MTAEQAIAFFLFAIVTAITPGPSNLILTSTGANVGVLRGLPCLGGVASGMGRMMFLTRLFGCSWRKTRWRWSATHAPRKPPTIAPTPAKTRGSAVSPAGR